MVDANAGRGGAPIPREELWRRIEARLVEDTGILAAWEGGSAATGRVDERSDLDLVVVVAPDAIAATFASFEETLVAISPIASMFRLPEPTWHGHAQAFYRLRDADPAHFIDFVAMRSDAREFFLQPELHGSPRVIVDRLGIEIPAPLERSEVDATNRARITSIAARHRTYGILPRKELDRGRVIDALAFLQSITIRHLVELLRIIHDPCRATFGLRYLDRDLPDAERDRLEGLLLVGSAEALGRSITEANAWIEECLGELDVDELES